MCLTVRGRCHRGYMMEEKGERGGEVREMIPMELGKVLAWLIYCWTSEFASTMSRVWRFYDEWKG